MQKIVMNLSLSVFVSLLALGNLGTAAITVARAETGPTLVATSPSSGVQDMPINTSIVLTFSESMNTDFAEGVQFSLNPDPGDFTVEWQKDDTVAILSSPDLTCEQFYNVYLTESAITTQSAGASLGTSGSVATDWSFVTDDCDDNNAAAPMIYGITYEGPSCDTANEHEFWVNAVGITQVLSASSSLFTGATTTDVVIDTPTFITATFSEGTTTGYLIFKSSSGSQSLTYTYALDAWDEACAEEEEEPTPEEVPEEEEELPEGVSAGDLIVSSTSTSVYYVTEDNTRRVFLNEQTYFTWYENFDDIVTVEPETLASLPLGPSMLPQAGVVLVKIQSSPVVYALEEGENLIPTLREIPDEDTAIEIYGSAWADYVIDIEPTFFTRFGMGAEIGVDEDYDANMNIMKKRSELVAE